MPEDDPTSGEFLIGEFGHVDTVMLHPGLGAELSGNPRPGSEEWVTGVELLGQLAPHAAAIGAGDDFRSGCFDDAEAAARTSPASCVCPWTMRRVPSGQSSIKRAAAALAGSVKHFPNSRPEPTGSADVCGSPRPPRHGLRYRELVPAFGLRAPGHGWRTHPP